MGRWWAILGCWLLGSLAAGAASEQPHGLPFIRSYPLDEIGNAPRSLKLGFDTFGRIAVMYDGIYAVLNDTAWVDRIDRSSINRVRMSTIQVHEGKYFYGGRGSWGMAVPAADGHLRAMSLVPPEAPEWTKVTAFNNLMFTTTGVYFYDLNGVVFWDFARQQNRFYEMPRVATAFAVGERVFVSCQDQALRELLNDTGESRIIDDTGIDGHGVERAVILDGNHALLSLYDGRLMVFDGRKAWPWPAQAEHQIAGRVTAMQRLVEGGVAIAMAGQGIYLFSADGALQWSLRLPEFRQINTIAAGEAGVIWAAGENAIHRIFYDSPLTGFGQQLGVTATWPGLLGWNDHVVICSGGTLYEMESTAPGHVPTFRILADKNTRQADAAAASGPHLLVGNQTEVFSVQPDGTQTSLIAIEHVAGMAFVRPDTCVVLGSREVAVLQWVDGGWQETAPRIPGVGAAPINTAVYGDLWVEFGGDQVGRLLFADGVLALQRIKMPWREEQWTNVGAIGDRIVFSGATGHRAYFDAAQGKLCEAPNLDALLSRSPYWILRIKADQTGTLWATYAQGVVTFTPEDGDYRIDAETFELPNDSYPSVSILPGNDLWIGAARSLYHVEHQRWPVRRAEGLRLVSLVCEQQEAELLDQAGQLEVPADFSFGHNSLTFRFFSGTYAWRSPPAYQYRLGPAEAWTPFEPSLVLRLRQLREGNYQLEVRPSGPHEPSISPLRFAFVIHAPWYRTTGFYVVCGLLVTSGLVGFVRWTFRRSLERNAALERLVHERTEELEKTMEKLGEESRNAATLAERSRLANEIHDSMQQGLSGTILHLETTMTHPSIIPEVHAQLNVMRKMLSYSREEVQQAVWNLESPLLENSTLGEALRTLTGFINSAAIELTVVAPEGPATFDPGVQHNLLRIAQEAITNAVKHAQPQHIAVTLEAQSDRVQLSVADDGIGFDLVAGSAVAGHFGLRGMRARAKAIGADLTLETAPGRGTTVRVIVRR